MVRTSVPLLFAVLVLGGCTVTVYDKPGTNKPIPPPAAAPRAPAHPVQTGNVMRPAFGNQPAATARPAPPPLPTKGGATVSPVGASKTVNPGVTPQVAPPVTSPTVFGNGNSGAFRGLAYVLSPDTKRIPDLSQITPFATVFTDSFQVKPQAFTGGFPGALMQEDWFAIRYEGLFNVPADGPYLFKMMADDGAQLVIDGVVVLDDQVGGPGSRIPTGWVAQTTTLKAGTHKLRVDYMQAEKGNVSLELFMDPAKNGMQAATPLVGLTPGAAVPPPAAAVPAVTGRGIPAPPGERPKPGTK